MKKMTCAQVGGGDCTAEFMAETAEEMKQKMTDHAMEAHADMMNGMDDEAKTAWAADFQTKWDETPEMESEASEVAPEEEAAA